MGIRFDGRVAVVTGAGSGLGRSYALLLSSLGCKVVVNDVGASLHGDVGTSAGGEKRRQADVVVDEIRSNGGNAVANYDSVEFGAKIVDTAIHNYGKIDILINNAGILRDMSFAKMTEKDWDLVMLVHLKGTFSCTKAAWKYMQKQKYGRIVNTASASGLYGNFGQANYSSAKLAILGFSKAISLEGRKNNILVNCIAPLAGTRMTETIFPKEVVEVLKPECVAPLVAFLSSDSCNDTGEVYEVGAGWIAKVRWERANGYTFPIPFTADDVDKKWRLISDFSQGSSHPTSMQDSLKMVTRAIGKEGGQSESRTRSSSPSTSSPSSSVPGDAEKLFALMGAYLSSQKSVAAELIKKVSSVFHFEVLQKKGDPSSRIGQWTIDLKNPPGGVVKGVKGKADASFSMTESDFVAVCLGTMNPQLAFMQGKMRIKGSMPAATKFTPQLFPKIDQKLLNMNLNEAMEQYLGVQSQASSSAGSGMSGGGGPVMSEAARRLKSSKFFEMIMSHFNSPEGAKKASKIGCLYRIDIIEKKGEKPCIFTIDMRKSPPRLEEAIPSSFDAHFTMSDDDFLGIVTGKLNPQLAFMQGKMKIKGNMKAAMKFTPDLFPKISKL